MGMKSMIESLGDLPFPDTFHLMQELTGYPAGSLRAGLPLGDLAGDARETWFKNMLRRSNLRGDFGDVDLYGESPRGDKAAVFSIKSGYEDLGEHGTWLKQLQQYHRLVKPGVGVYQLRVFDEAVRVYRFNGL